MVNERADSQLGSLEAGQETGAMARSSRAPIPTGAGARLILGQTAGNADGAASALRAGRVTGALLAARRGPLDSHRLSS